MVKHRSKVYLYFLLSKLSSHMSSKAAFTKMNKKAGMRIAACTVASQNVRRNRYLYDCHLVVAPLSISILKIRRRARLEANILLRQAHTSPLIDSSQQGDL